MDFRQSGAMPTDAIARTLGSNIRAEMGRQRVSMAELARRVQISRTTLMHQIDVSSISAPTLLLIAKALGVEMSALLPDDAEQASA